MNWNDSKEKICRLISESSTKADVLRSLGLSPSGGNHRNLNMYIKTWNVDISHMKGRSWAKGKTAKTDNRVKKCTKRNERPFNEVFCKNSTYASTHLYGKIKKYNILPLKCSMKDCNVGETWKNKRLRLHVDHINGNHSDHRVENLRLLCPNCHSQTSTYGNKKKKQASVSKFGKA